MRWFYGTEVSNTLRPAMDDNGDRPGFVMKMQQGLAEIGIYEPIIVLDRLIVYRSAASSANGRPEVRFYIREDLLEVN